MPQRKICPHCTTDTKNSSQDGLRYGLTRATFIIREELWDKVKSASYWNRLTVKEIMQSAIEKYLQEFPEETIKPIKNCCKQAH